MRKAQVVFDISEMKTQVTITDSKGISEKIDITDTKVEKAFTRLLKQINQENYAKQIVNAIDINTWEQV